ncbi:aminoglycoside efflux pump [Klebsiella pneumoniae]|uniref:Aminoglycoside efflux pump n=1 Tax=Klebsiella pneumoniae TaxID=573 RepID=A0A2X3E9W9_KLEPN|nr:aminoglycoside efflux pump [Klebsiella pneumoniae]
MANFFIDRPILHGCWQSCYAWTGTLAILSLPVEQYPDLAPPNVRITANYPGASAQTLENTVTQVIEQNMTGLDNLMYMSSRAAPPARRRSPSALPPVPTRMKPCSRFRTSYSRRCVSCRRRCKTRG